MFIELIEYPKGIKTNGYAVRVISTATNQYYLETK